MMTRALVELGDITPHNIKQVKKINLAIFPITYNDQFYADVLEAGDLSKIAYYNDIVVGAVCSRVEETGNSRLMYVMTLGCLRPYRRLGVGTMLIQHIITYAEKDGAIDGIFLHVQVNNLIAIEFYKKFGFDIIEVKRDYYKIIGPSDAYVLRKSFTKNIIPFVSNHLKNNCNFGKKEKKKVMKDSQGDLE